MHDDDSTDDLRALLARVPVALRRALEEINPAAASELAEEFLASDEEDQAGMLAFVESGGPRRCRELRLKHYHGVPTSSDLEGWLSQDGGRQ